MPNTLEQLTFSARRNAASSAKATNRAFVVEALILLAFLAVSVAIVLQLFSSAGIMSREAHKLSMSEHLATNAAETFGANPVGIEEVAYFDKDGNKLLTDVGAVYKVETQTSAQRNEAGITYDATITVTNYEMRYDGDVTYTLETRRYLSSSEGGSA